MIDIEKRKERELIKEELLKKKKKNNQVFYIKFIAIAILATAVFSFFSNPDKQAHFEVIFPPQDSKNPHYENGEELIGYHNCIFYSYAVLNKNHQKATYGYLGKVYFYSDFTFFHDRTPY